MVGHFSNLLKYLVWFIELWCHDFLGFWFQGCLFVWLEMNPMSASLKLHFVFFWPNYCFMGGNCSWGGRELIVVVVTCYPLHWISLMLECNLSTLEVFAHNVLWRRTSKWQNDKICFIAIHLRKAIRPILLSYLM